MTRGLRISYDILIYLMIYLDISCRTPSILNNHRNDMELTWRWPCRSVVIDGEGRGKLYGLWFYNVLYKFIQYGFRTYSECLSLIHVQ